MFKELLRIDAVPVVVSRLAEAGCTIAVCVNFSGEPGYLVDTLLSERDYYRDRIHRATCPRPHRVHVCGHLGSDSHRAASYCAAGA